MSKMRGIEKIKNEFNKGINIKNCKCNYTGTKNGYPDEIKQEAIIYYLEGIGFRRIERLSYISHVSVISRIRKAARQIRIERINILLRHYFSSIYS